MSHTPGPWHIVQVELGLGIVADNGVPVAQLCSPFPDVEQELACKIAAAPDLLEACEAVAVYLMQDDSFGYGDPAWDSATSKLRTAIAKARGEVT